MTSFSQFQPSVNTSGLDPYSDCPEVQKLRCMQATVEYFICVYGEKEAVELSNIDNPSSNAINTKRIQFALDDAFAYIVNYYSAASASAKVLIQSALRRTQATIARYYLDTLRPRDAVVEAYEKAIQQLDIWSARSSAQSLNKFSQAYKYYRESADSEGVSLVRSAHEKKRIFTAATLEPWVWGCSSNDVDNIVRYEDQKLSAHYQIGNGVGTTSPTGTKMPESLQQINRLYDTLDRTVMVGNHEETKSESKRTPEEGELLALNPNTDDSSTTTVDEDNLNPDNPINLTF